MNRYAVTEDDIIFEDEVLLVANKPAGLPCQGTDQAEKDHFYAALTRYLNGGYLAIHHRLDAPTSGLMIFSKSRQFNKGFTDLFRDRKVEKKYLALVWCSKECPDEWKYENKLKKIRQGRFLISKEDVKGDLAVSNFKLLEKSSSMALLECSPLTGRMHQLRVHLANQDMPVVGDWVYGKKSNKSRMMLHAWKLSFAHPKTRRLLELEAPIPFEFKL